MAGAESVAGANAPLPPVAPPVLWTPATLRPLLDQCVPVVEKLAKQSLATEAAKISPAAEKLVAEQGGWNPVARTALQESGAALGAKLMNQAGISAEYAPEVQFGLALASILGGHMMLLAELKALAVEKRGAIEIQTVKKENVPHDQAKD